MIKKSLLITFAGVILSGCSTIQRVPVIQQKVLADDPVLVAIAKSAQLIADSEKKSSQINMALKQPDITLNQQQLMASQTNYVPQDLQNRVTIPNFDGDYLKIIEAVTRASGWTPAMIGTKPPLPQLIHKSYDYVRVYDILKDIGYSISGATIIVNPPEKQVIVRFDK